MGTKASEPRRRLGLAAILRWSGALVVLGILMVALLALPFHLYAVRTGSMQPEFASRAMVVVHTGEYQLGQPISFTHSGATIAHRFVSINADGSLVTRGDANRTLIPGQFNDATEVIGGVVASLPKHGYWLVYLKSLPGLGSVLLASVGVCLLWSIAREFDEEPGEVANLSELPREKELALAKR